LCIAYKHGFLTTSQHPAQSATGSFLESARGLIWLENLVAMSALGRFAWNMRRWDTTGNFSDRQTVLRASGDDSVLDRQGNPKMSAALMDKAADVKSKVDELGAPLDLTPLAPDIEPPPAT
jgi:hypothetical protein